jgi:hypothetical protein
VREKLPEYEVWNTDHTHAETSDLAVILMTTIGKPCKSNLLYGGTMANLTRYVIIPSLKLLGYRTFTMEMLVPEAESL